MHPVQSTHAGIFDEPTYGCDPQWRDQDTAPEAQPGLCNSEEKIAAERVHDPLGKIRECSAAPG